MSSFASPLRYPGGKARLTRYVAEVLRLNGLSNYAEPYAGGAGIPVSLLLAGYVGEVHLNDIDPALFAFWTSVLNHTDDLCRLIRDTPVNMETWYVQRRILEKADTATTVELGFAAFFLNRTNRSGILRGGVIGGRRQAGKWKLDARFNKTDLIQRIERIALYRDRIHLHNMDAAAFIREIVPRLPLDTLVYLDPPYYAKGGALYEHHYEDHDHQHIADLVQNSIRQPWMVSYDNHPRIRELYSARRQEVFDLYYSAHLPHRGLEVMIFSDDLRLPPSITTSRSTRLDLVDSNGQVSVFGTPRSTSWRLVYGSGESVI